MKELEDKKNKEVAFWVKEKQEEFFNRNKFLIDENTLLDVKTKELRVEFEDMNKKYDLIKSEFEKLTKEIDNKNDTIDALKRRVNGDTSIVVPRAQVSPEEVIAETQLKLLEERAMRQTLTLEEIKIYDLLVKNKRLTLGQSTENASYRVLPANTDEKSLLEIAQSNVQEE